MTEENNIETTETENIEQVDTQEPTVKVAEMKRRIEAERTKAQEQIEELNKSMEQRIAEEVKKAQEVAQLNGKELEEYKQKEQQKKYEDEIAKRDAELEKLRQENLQRTIRDEAHTKLTELNINITPETISLVEGNTLDEMAEKAELLAKYTTAIKNHFAGSDAPISSGGSAKGVSNDTTFDMLRNLTKK